MLDAPLARALIALLILAVVVWLLANYASPGLAAIVAAVGGIALVAVVFGALLGGRQPR